MSEQIKRPISNSALSINPRNKRVSKELNFPTNEDQIVEASLNNLGTSQVPRAVLRSSMDERKDASANALSGAYVSSELITMVPSVTRSRPASEVYASRHNVSDASTITPSPGSDLSLLTNSKRGSDDQIDGRTHATGTMTSGQASGNWGWFEDVHNDPATSSPMVKKGRDGEVDGDQEHGDMRRNSEIRRGLLQFTMSNIKPLIDMVWVARQDQDTGSMAVSAPNYVLEESISSQKLWRHTAGNRPPQPVEERAYFEQIWAQNFLQSQVKYQAPLDVLLANSPIHLSPYADGGFSDTTADVMVNYNVAFHNPTVFGGGADRRNANKANEIEVAEATILQRASTGKSPAAGGRKVKSDSDGTLTVLVKGDNVFGTTVSKSFPRTDGSPRIDTISISIASYRVVQPKQRGNKYAQFLVVYREGSFQNTVGVWKRYSDFDALANRVASGPYGCSECSSILSRIHPLTVDVGEHEEKEILPNALTSWRLLKKRQRWYRCLDAGYLSLKVFLLERFLHDVLFECSNPQILRDFIGVDLLQ